MPYLICVLNYLAAKDLALFEPKLMVLSAVIRYRRRQRGVHNDHRGAPGRLGGRRAEKTRRESGKKAEGHA